MNLYRRKVTRTRTNYVLRRKTNQNALLRRKKDAKNEVACDVTNYFNVSNVFGCGRNNPDVSCERACMATEYNEYFTDIIDTLNECQDRHGQRLSSEKLKEYVLRVMDEEEEEIELDINNITCDTPFLSPVT